MVKIIENVEKEAVEHSAVILATSTLIETKLKEIKQLNKDIESAWDDIDKLQNQLAKSISKLREKWNVTIKEEG